MGGRETLDASLESQCGSEEMWAAMVEAGCGLVATAEWLASGLVKAEAMPTYGVKVS